MFVNGKPVRVTVDGQNVIFIRPKMDFGAKNRVMDALARVRNAKTEREGADIEAHFGSYQIALMIENIVSWSGPAFVGRQCNAANIEMLDPDEPLVEKVVQEIAERNPLVKRNAEERPEETAEREAAEKKGGMNAGAPSPPESG